MHQLTLSVVMPCFNEGEAIDALLREWLEYLAQNIPESELIVVNDGSSDGTGRCLDKLRKEFRRLRVIHQLNTGHELAVRRGYEAARGEYLFQVDSDGRYELSDFARLWEGREGKVAVLGARTHRLDSLLQRGIDYLLGRTMKWAFKLEWRDPSVPFRLMRRDLVASYLKTLPSSTQSVNLLLACFLKKDYPEACSEIAIPYRLRARGLRRKQGLSRRLRLAAQVHGEIVLYRLRPDEATLTSPSLAH